MHELYLSNYNIARFLYSIEKRLNAKLLRQSSERKYVLVSGLARSGTTKLTQLLNDNSKFDSLAYTNMPFLLMPRTWKKINKSRDNKLKQRSHKDGVLHGYDSIEALEEFFWKVFTNDSYVNKTKLNKHDVSELIDEYHTYQQLIKKKSENIYLAKNNNFLLRYGSISEHDKDIRLLLTYRDPFQHASSLLRQHKNFCKQQTDDPFVLDYMTWIGHYEFGLNKKAFSFSDVDEITNYSEESVNYWLLQWYNYYNYALSFKNDDKVFFCLV